MSPLAKECMPQVGATEGEFVPQTLRSCNTAVRSPINVLYVRMYMLFVCVLFMYLVFIVGLLYEAVLTRIVEGLSPWRPVFDPRPV